MDSIADFFDRVLTLLLLPATLYGGGGALMRANRKNRPVGQALFEIIGGVITTHMFSNAIVEYVPTVWQHVAYFLAGMGGLELVGRIYEAAESALIRRLSKRISGE